MPGGVAPRALLGVLALIVAIALAVVPVVEARPKDKGDGKKDRTTEETARGDETGRPDVVYVEDAAATEQPPVVGAPEVSNERTLLELDADGDYIPDALDNCPNVQNPDQADADGDGAGDSCMVYQDLDGDTVPDKQDNCPNIATSDFSDRDGDGVGDSCDKSPDGIEPEPEPLPELGDQGGGGETEAPAPENGENLNGVEIERDGRTRSRQRERTDISKPVITTGSEADVDGSNADAQGSDAEAEGIGGPPAQDATSYEEPARDNPRRNEELIAEAAASGELFALPEPPPVPQRAWDEEVTPDAAEWNSIIKIDSGATDDAESAGQRLADNEPNDSESRAARGGGNQEQRAQSNEDVIESQFARGWVRAKLLLQDELPDDGQGSGDSAGEDDATEDGAARGGPEESAPVPVENGLVFTGAEDDDESASERDAASETGDAEGDPDLEEEALPEAAAESEDEPELLDQEVAPLDEETASGNDRRDSNDTGNRDEEVASRRDGSRRDGSSRAAAAAAPERQRTNVNTDEPRQNTQEKERRDRRDQELAANAGGWTDDHFFEGGSALDWRGSYGVAGTDDADLYLTQRSGAGPGKRRGFDYVIPVGGNGIYLVRLYFAEPYWGSPGGPDGDPGQRIFSVTAEGETMFEDLDVFAEVGALTALVKQGEVDVQDGELNLSFIAIEGEPIVAAIEILQPAQ